MKKKGIEMDYGKRERFLFLEGIRQEGRWDRYVKWILLFAIIYFGAHIYVALGTEPVIINQPDGGQKVCIVDGRYITCY
jgi:hypothetical protein